MTEDPQAEQIVVRVPQTRGLSSQVLIVGMVLLGVAATALLFIYWDQQTRPFRPLRELIGREFRHSRPNVEGGRQKGRGPRILRISMSVEFPPEDMSHANPVIDRVLELSRQQSDLKDFEQLEINLIQFVPQEVAKTKKFTFSATDATLDRR